MTKHCMSRNRLSGLTYFLYDRLIIKKIWDNTENSISASSAVLEIYGDHVILHDNASSFEKPTYLHCESEESVQFAQWAWKDAF